MDDSDIICIKLEQDSDITPLLMEGECNFVPENITVFKSTIIYVDSQKTRNLGTVFLYIKNTLKWDHITKHVISLTTLSLTLFFTLVIITTIAFRSTITTPLSRVSESLKLYRTTGQRKPVDWDTPDELGQLINNYNRNLILQTETEVALNEAYLKTEKALSSLKEAQTILIQSEKMASLGSLVAGIAHEINTPLGNSLTVATTVSQITGNIRKEIDSGTLTKSALNEFIESITEAATILERNLETAANQIRNFKNVAVDQTSEKRRLFDVKQVIEEVVYTLKPQIKHTHFKIETSVPTGIKIDSYPGPLGQIITNCFNNALIHGFEGKTHGLICIKAGLIDEQYLSLEITDNGNGMSTSACEKAFDPFYTTKLGNGGSGLGLNLVYNLTTTILGGTVNIKSTIDMGVKFTFMLPS